MEKEIWEKAVAFHGHACPGLAIGVRAATLLQEQWHITRGEDESWFVSQKTMPVEWMAFRPFWVAQREKAICCGILRGKWHFHFMNGTADVLAGWCS